MCAVICRKVTLTLPDANFLFARAQNCHFCALFSFGALVFGHFEHKIGVFVLFWLPEPLFSGLSSTKRAFLCQKGQLFPGFTPSRAQNRGFCARVAVVAETLKLSPASGRAIKKRVTSKSPNGLFSYPPLWIGICCRCNWGRNICCCRWNRNGAAGETGTSAAGAITAAAVL